MRYLLISSIVLFSSLTSLAQKPNYQGLLWKISGNGLDQPSFLYGTMHVSNKVAFHLSDSFYKAIASVDVVALEINPETWMKTMTEDSYIANQMGNAFSAKGDYVNSGFYKAIFELEGPENRAIGEYLGQELGILNSLLYRTSNYSADFEEDTYLDLFIFQAGKKQGKEITGLEKLGNTMKLSEKAAMPETDPEKKKAQKKDAERRRHELRKVLDDRNFTEAMEDAYRKGDLILLDSLSRLSTINENYHNLIIVERNKGMAHAIDSIIQNKQLFAGIGAAHLPNNYGVIHLLKEMGYTVVPVSNKKSDFGADAKDDLEEAFITHEFTKQTSYDGIYSTSMPGKLYEFPESNNVMMAAYPDMANGATYVITRIQTYGPLAGISQSQYIDKIDSLLYENIPGKILSKERIEIDGVPGIDIHNETKKGDHQRYHIMVRPLEIIIFKVGGKKEYIQREEVNQFFDNLRFYTRENKKSSLYTPKNNAYTVSLPGDMVYESEANEFKRGYWRKNVQSYNRKDQSYYGVFNRTYTDFSYIEEDSFELSQIARKFTEQFHYEIATTKHDSFGPYPSFEFKANKKNAKSLYGKLILKASQYYLIFAQTADSKKAEAVFKSFKFSDYHYDNEFKAYSDTSLFFDVITPVEPVNNLYNYYSYYEEEEEEDNSHEEEFLSHSYYNKATEETIYVRYRRFHKYYYQKDVDSVWKELKGTLSEEGDFFVRSSKKWKEEDTYYYELEVGDTNSIRNLLGKFILQDGVCYALYSETDKSVPRSKFIDTFFTTFTPWDTTIGVSVLKSKTALFLADLHSSDSITREAAYRSMDVVQFQDQDVNSIINAIENTHYEDHNIEIKAFLLNSLGNLESDKTLTYLKTKYKQIEDTVQYQIPILSAIASQRTKKSTQLFCELLLSETPLSEESYEIYKLFYPFADSLALMKDLYPEILLLASLPEYNSKVYSYLASIKGKGYISKRDYKSELKQIVWEANNEIKRQKSKESGNSSDYYKTVSRYNIYSYNSALYNYAVILLPFEKRNGKVKKFFDRLEQLNSPGLQMDLAVLRAKNNLPVADSVWLHYAANPNHRMEIYDKLKNIEKLDLFPKQYLTSDAMALSLFVQQNRINLDRDSVQLVSKKQIKIESDSGYIYFYKIKSSYNDEWRVGYFGLLPWNGEWEYPKQIYSNDKMIYSKYEDLDKQIKMQIRRLQMQNRSRYKVEDEKEFKDIKVSNAYRRY